jgi:hypothetical protein
VCARTSLQDFSMASSNLTIPDEVSPEVSVQITKDPLLRRVVLRRVYSFTHSFPTRRIRREFTLPIPLIGMSN